MFVLLSPSPGNAKACVFVRVRFSDKLGNVISARYPVIEGVRLNFSEKSISQRARHPVLLLSVRTLKCYKTIFFVNWLNNRTISKINQSYDFSLYRAAAGSEV